MNIKERIVDLKLEVEDRQAALDNAVFDLSVAERSIENHVYESLERAESRLCAIFEGKAHEDCEGAGNCGEDEYTQDFIVDGKEYVATMTFDYNRHDKTYYYIDGREFSYKEKV